MSLFEVGLVFMLVGLVVSVVGQLWFVLGAFVESVLWGVAILIVPGAGLLYLVRRTDVALKPMLVMIGGLMITAWGLALASDGGSLVLFGTLGVGALLLVVLGLRMLATAPKPQPRAQGAAAPTNPRGSDEALRKAVRLIEAGDRAGAREALIAILKSEPENDQAWMWMAEAVESERLRQESLQEALKHNPHNWRARNALQLAGGELV